MSTEHPKTSLLIEQIKDFFESLTPNKDTLQLALAIQKQLEKGDTAIKCEAHIDDAIISTDGQKGYIVQDNGLAGFRRYYNQEQYIKSFFLHTEKINIEFNTVKKAIHKVLELIEYEHTTELDLQWQACISSVFNPCFILSGGPGTGKTSTVVRMMLMFLAIDSDKTIALAAPTGKAANRMMQSIGHLMASIHVEESWRITLTRPAQTIHRLLGYNHHNNQMKYNEHNPLPYDYIIIDEASMLDVTMTYSLLKALKPSAHLLLMGDKDQLPAVEAGNVFTNLCELLNNDQHQDLLHYYLNESGTDEIEMNNYVDLKKNYRFNEESVIGQACDSLIAQDAEQFMALKQHDSFNWINPITQTEKLTYLKQWYQEIPAGESMILLSPVNFGSNSVTELNELAVKIHHKHYGFNHNMPVMVTKNDYTLGVFNGDIGNLQKIGNTWHIPFNIESETRNIPIDAINHWTIAYAISIHKSQGSEYDHVLITIPDDNELELLTNSLLFTAISRAKKSITLWSSEGIIRKIIETKHRRVTFLQ